jgi:tRNA pseudouridine38-40 synthase
MRQSKTWRLWVSYLGTSFHGFQKQPGQPSIEQAFLAAFERLIGYAPEITPAGRTDSGVHARGQVVSCTFESRFDSRTLPLALSHLLGPDIAVYRADEMPEIFNARFHAIGKRYVYRISQNMRAHPFEHAYTWHVASPLNLEAMQEAANYLVGEHDFESFRSSSCVAEHARRYLWKIKIPLNPPFSKGEILPPFAKGGPGGISIDIRGNAFCHNQVRIITGTLVEVGLGKYSPERVKEILLAKDRTLAGRTAPAHGLTLEEVYYPDDLSRAEIPEGAKFPRYPVTNETWPC